LASATGVHAEALGRLLRLLSGYGVFQQRDGRYGHTPMSRLLRTDHPQSIRPLVRMLGLPIFWASVGELEDVVRTGRPRADKQPEGIWDYFSSHPEESRIFNKAMTAKAYSQIPGIVAAYDFSGFEVIGDIGGGRGHLLTAVLDSAPSARGVLFDLPHAIEAAENYAPDRISFQKGDFFKDRLPRCDAYLIMEVIHDWDDEHARKILRAVRSAAPAHAKVLIVEAIVPEDPSPSWPKLLDLWMLAVGGKQRTLQEYVELLAEAQFRFTREIGTNAGGSIIKAIPVNEK
jgi:hypothetical protein